MRMSLATRVAAVAVSLSLAGGMATAAPDGQRGYNENPGAQEQRRGDQDGRDRTRRNAKPDANQAPAANQRRVRTPESQTRNERQGRSVERTRDRYHGVRNERGRNNQVTDRARDNRDRGRGRNVGDRNNRRDWGDRARDNRDNSRNYGDRNDRRVWGDRDRRQRVNIQQYHRNFNAPRRYRTDAYRWRNGNSYRRYSYGQRLPRHHFPRNFWIVNFLTYDLFAPPPGYIWVRYGPDALLIDQYTGEIVQVRYGMFYS